MFFDGRSKLANEHQAEVLRIFLGCVPMFKSNAVLMRALADCIAWVAVYTVPHAWTSCFEDICSFFEKDDMELKMFAMCVFNALLYTVANAPINAKRAYVF